ncbi:MAG: hypothetical protein EBY50_06980, partial [Rhodobacteraceae bacterium]|nr:hypothetical protein [Paracoccaceae bacterium]
MGLLTGADAEFFEVEGSQLFLKAGTQLDYSTKDQYSVTLSVFDDTVEDSQPQSVVVDLGITPRSGPTSVSFSSVRDSLSEETGTTRRKWLG